MPFVSQQIGNSLLITSVTVWGNRHLHIATTPYLVVTAGIKYVTAFDPEVTQLRIFCREKKDMCPKIAEQKTRGE